jgi:hypothetical protein
MFVRPAWFASKLYMNPNAEIAARSLADSAQAGPRPLSCRSRLSNKPHKMAIDGRSQLGRRLHDLAASFAVQLGGWSALSDTMAANVRKAAELSALAEQSRTEALRNGNIDPLALVRLEGAANRAVRALNLDRKHGSSGPSLAQYLAARDAEPLTDVFDNECAEDAGDEQTLTDELPDGSEADATR